MTGLSRYNQGMGEQVRVDLVGVGSNATDLVIGLEQFPGRGSKSEYTSESTQAGGSIATAIVACQKWGLATRYVGKLGDDDAGRLHRREFARFGVDACIVQAVDTPSARSVIIVDSEGERTVLGRRDERIVLRAEELRREWVVAAGILHLDSHDMGAALQAARWAQEAGVLVVADIDAFYAGTEELLHLIDFPVFSRDFPTRLTGLRDVGEALREIYAHFRPKVCAATLGAEGVIAWDGKELVHRPTFRVNAIDTTGAGDIFHAGFIYGLAQGWPMLQQLDFACAAAALNCTALGARGNIGTRDEVETLLRSGERYPLSAISESLVAL